MLGSVAAITGRWRGVAAALVSVCGAGLVVAFLAWPAGAHVVAAAAVAGTDIDPAAVDAFVEAYRERTGLPGVAVAITRGDRVVHVAGYGTSSDGWPLGARTRLPIASLSKSFASLAIMQLVEVGQVDLDQPVRRYLPEFVVADPRGGRITVRQLLDHTSGMADTEFREKSVPPPGSLRAGVALLRTARLVSDPGARVHYHNPNYWVAARLVEVVGAEPFAAYLRHHVLDPAGMRATTTVGSLRAAPDVAPGHIRLYGASVARPEPSWYLDGSSGVVTTAEDLAQWLIVQSRGGVAANGARLVSTRSVDAMHREHLGWGPGPEPGAFAHGGWLFTFTAQQVLLPPTGYGLAVVTNRGVSLGPDDSVEIMRALVGMTHGAMPDLGAPVGRIVDLVLLVLTLAVAALAVRGLRRADAWSRRRRDRPTALVALALLPWAIPTAALAGLRRILGIVFGGRDGTWLQVLYVAPSFVVWLAVSASCGLAIILLRTANVWHLRRLPGDRALTAGAGPAG
jgi:CubicO group peptidase (beta-lactamase class C family)